jgi:hypothetical protein
MGDDASIYRAFSDFGIGEGPGSTVGAGVQYQDSGSSLEQNRTFLEAAKLWMNLDEGDWGNLGDDFEAWSVAPIEKDVLVARLVRFREYGAMNRPNFFAHGRAVAHAEIEGAFDPGAWISDAQAFDEPWLGRRRDPPSPPPAPRPPAVAHVAADTQLATSLLAHLLEARLQNRPLIWRVGPQEFRQSGKAATLASFARAGLPLAVRHGCFVRVYTALPERFLELGATFVVIQDDRPPILQGATRRRPDAFVLATDGQRTAGDEPRPTVAAYADALVKRFCDRPEALLLFGARAHAAIGGADPAGSRRAYGILYNVSEYARTGSLDQALGFVARQLEERPLGSPPSDSATIFSSEEWGRFSLAALVAIVLRDAREPEAQALRRACTRQITEVRKITLDTHPEIQAWCQSFTSGQLVQLSQFMQMRVVSHDLAGRLLRQVGVDTLPTLSAEQLRPLLRVIDWRECLRLEESDVLALARNGGALDLINAVASQPNPLPPWVAAYVTQEPLPQLHADAGKAVIGKAAADDRWRAPARLLINRLLADSQTVAWAGYFADVDTQPFHHDLELLVLLEELKSRARGGTPSMLLRDRGLAPGFYKGLEAGQRRTWVQLALDPAWSSLTPAFLVSEGQCLPPADPAYDDELWGGLRSLLKPRPARRLLDALRSRLGPDDERRAHREREFMEQIDRTLERQPQLANEWFGPLDPEGHVEESVAEYSEWRRSSSVSSPEVFDAVARAWFTGAQWKIPKRTARLNDWRVAMEDLAGRLDARSMTALIKETAAPLGFPRVERLERQQMDGLCQAAADLPAFAALARELGARLRNRPLDAVSVFLEDLKSDAVSTLVATARASRSPRFASLSPAGVTWLMGLGLRRDTGTEAVTLGLEDASALWDALGPAHEDAALEFVRAALASLGDNPTRAVELAERHRLFADVTDVSDWYISRLRDVLIQYHATPAIREAAAALERRLTVDVRQRAAAGKSKEGKTAREVAARHLRGFPNVARFIDPLTVAGAGSGNDESLAQQLLRGAGDAWDELASAYKGFLQTGAGESPLLSAYADLTMLGPLSDAGADEVRKVMVLQFRRWPEMLQPGPRFSDGIPAVRLLLLMDGRGVLHCLRWVVARAADTNLGLQLLRDPLWWQVLNADVERLRPLEVEDDRASGRLLVSARLAELGVKLSADEAVGDAAWSAARGRRPALSRASVRTLRALQGRRR